MPNAVTLKTQLDRLHRELVSARSLDPETRKLLETIARDIEQALHGKHDTQSLREPLQRIETATLRFEAEHPALSRILSEVADTLAKIGV
ncbi:MAG TPA: DUF4404 family protein [Gammaproteobacteria bacterium]|nr:DUF4404 family protein [Gammaproteobacteria bacterium]